MARSSFSGGIEGRPMREYIAEKSRESAGQAPRSQAPDGSQRMILAEPSFQIDVTENSAPARFPAASHPAPQNRLSE